MKACIRETKRKNIKAEIDRLLELLSIWEKINNKDELKKSIKKRIMELEQMSYDEGYDGSGYPGLEEYL